MRDEMIGMEWKIPLATVEIGQEEIDAVTSVIKSGWLTMGEITREFEERFAEKLNVKYAFSVNNCTAALHLANVILGITEGDEVICTRLSFVASANATRYTGAEVIFADVISEDDLTISPEDIERKITDRTKAITIVHYAGHACRMEEILAIAQKYNLKIIEDCAHSPFAKYQFSDGSVKSTGSIGDVGCFSFFSNKNMTTGEGGMLTTNSDELADKIRLLRSHGMTTLTYDRHKGHANSYDVVMLGYNYRPDEIHSSIGLCQLRKIDAFNEKRREVFAFYKEALLENNNVIMPFSKRDIQLATPHIMPIFIKDNYEKIKVNLKAKGIQVSKHYDFIDTFTIYEEKNKIDKSVIDTSKLITLPLGVRMKQEDISYIVNLLK